MNNHLMNNQERFVKWKCPECGNYHKWVWDIYDIFGGEITMTCDNPECGATSKMCMVPEKNGNATAIVSAFNNTVDNSQVEATEKVMNSQTEIDISKVLIDGDTATIMGEKYQRIIEPKSRTLKDIISEWIVIYNIRSDSVKDRITADLLERIETKWLPCELEYDGEEYDMGWNDAIKALKDKLR
jgi:uncharacterized Zn finger protein